MMCVGAFARAPCSSDERKSKVIAPPTSEAEPNTKTTPAVLHQINTYISDTMKLSMTIAYVATVAATAKAFGTTANAMLSSRGGESSATVLRARDDAGNFVAASSTFSARNIAGVVQPTGFFDPLGFAGRADEATVKRYREAELTHGRVAMLATVGFLAGEKVEGSSFLFDAQITGPAIDHLPQVPTEFWVVLVAAIGAAEQFRAEKGWVDPSNNKVDSPGQLEARYIPGDLGFDPLGLMPEREEDIVLMQTKELQHGRLAMIAAAGMMAQELVDHKGIVEHLSP